jgi:hypothetical protein
MHFFLILAFALCTLATNCLGQASWSYNIRFTLFDNNGIEVTPDRLDLPDPTYVQFESGAYPMQGIDYDTASRKLHMWGTAIGNTGLVILNGEDTMHISFHALHEVLEAEIQFRPGAAVWIAKDQMKELKPVLSSERRWMSDETVIRIIDPEY